MGVWMLNGKDWRLLTLALLTLAKNPTSLLKIVCHFPVALKYMLNILATFNHTHYTGARILFKKNIDK